MSSGRHLIKRLFDFDKNILLTEYLSLEETKLKKNVITKFVDNFMFKIARAKNNCPDLLIGAKTVGLNYFLLDKTIRPKFQNDGFLALANGAGVACATSKNHNIHELSGIRDSNS